MAQSYFYLTLDTTPPANPSIIIEDNAQFTAEQLVMCAISTSDANTAGYQIKIWGDVDASHDPNIKTTENDSSWFGYTTAKQVKLSSGDGNKTLYLRIRDDVHNVSAQVSDSITLDTTKPIVTITGPDVSKISKVTGKNEAAFSFVVDEDITEWKVKVVASTGAAHDTGTVISTAGGSQNMTGGELSEAQVVNCKIVGQDLENASPGDGQKIVKVFVKDNAGNWSA